MIMVYLNVALFATNIGDAMDALAPYLTGIEIEFLGVIDTPITVFNEMQENELVIMK